MKIAIMGFSGSGKSTLAKKLGKHFCCDVLHLDSVHFAPNWVERPNRDMVKDVGEFMQKGSWIIDGNYKSVLHQKRLEEADQIIIMDFNRFNCLWRAYKRYRTYKRMTREDMGKGCNEKFDWEFIRWILWEGRLAQGKRFADILKQYPDKSIVLKDQRQLDEFLKGLSDQFKI